MRWKSSLFINHHDSTARFCVQPVCIEISQLIQSIFLYWQSFPGFFHIICVWKQLYALKVLHAQPCSSPANAQSEVTNFSMAVWNEWISCICRCVEKIYVMWCTLKVNFLIANHYHYYFMLIRSRPVANKGQITPSPIFILEGQAYGNGIYMEYIYTLFMWFGLALGLWLMSAIDGRAMVCCCYQYSNIAY